MNDFNTNSFGFDTANPFLDNTFGDADFSIDPSNTFDAPASSDTFAAPQPIASDDTFIFVEPAPIAPFTPAPAPAPTPQPQPQPQPNALEQFINATPAPPPNPATPIITPTTPVSFTPAPINNTFVQPQPAAPAFPGTQGTPLPTGNLAPLPNATVTPFPAAPTPAPAPAPAAPTPPPAAPQPVVPVITPTTPVSFTPAPQPISNTFTQPQPAAPAFPGTQGTPLPTGNLAPLPGVTIPTFPVNQAPAPAAPVAPVAPPPPAAPAPPALVSPIGGSSVMTSGPNPSRIHPVYGTPRPHNGWDLAAPTGTPVLAAHGGRVETFYQAGGAGNGVIIDELDANGEPTGLNTRYYHLNSFNVKTGDIVQAGQNIGGVGSTGASTGPHLHFEIREGSTPQFNAASYFGNNVARNVFNEAPPISIEDVRGGAVLTEGTRSPAVGHVQSLLGVPVDNVYGSGTRAAVTEFQRNNGLNPDGVVGSQTLQLLENPALRPAAPQPAAPQPGF